MSSSISFGGKCVTVLIGIGLSWLTVSNPDIDQAVGQLFGKTQPMLESATISMEEKLDLETPFIDIPDNSKLTDSSSSLAEETEAAASSTLLEVKNPSVNEIASELRSRGASYLLLEKLPQQTGEQFRARCDLASPGDSVKCCFEAVRNTPEQAMLEVLQAVVAAQNG